MLLAPPRDPFDAALDATVFGDAALPVRVVAFERGLGWWREAFELFKRDGWPWIGAVLIFLVISTITLKLPWIGSILQHILQTVMIGGLCLGCQRVDLGGRFQVSSLFAGFDRRYLSRLVLMALALILVFVAFFLVVGIALGMAGLAFSIGHVQTLTSLGDLDHLPILFGSLLIATLAVSALVMAYWFAPALIVFYGVGPIDALRLSFVASLRNFAPMLAFGIVSTLLLIAGFLTAGIGFLVIGPVAFATVYTSTKDVFGAGVAPPVV